VGNWNDAEIEKLKLWYQQNDVPSDQLIKDNNALDGFTEWFNAKFGCNKTSTDIADQLLTLRKKGILPRLRK
jgi:5'-deoxynucleotidase YfbR-like HD superfamily hydrolase